MKGVSSGCARAGGWENAVKLRSPTLIVTFHPSIPNTFSADCFDVKFEIGTLRSRATRAAFPWRLCIQIQMGICVSMYLHIRICSCPIKVTVLMLRVGRQWRFERGGNPVLSFAYFAIQFERDLNG